MIISEKPHLNSAGGSHEGMVGKENEDRYKISAHALNGSKEAPTLFAIIADGIGGHKAGEVAADLAVNMISEDIAKSDAVQPSEILKKAIEKASDFIYKQSEKNEEQKGMGTTVACAFLIKKRLYIASVGDSRIYLLRDNKMSQINKDHSWVQVALDAGLLDPNRAKKHPYANLINRYLGSPEIVNVDLRLWFDPSDSEEQVFLNQGGELLNGDRLLLCTDGLSDMVYDEEIQEILAGNTVEMAVEKLIDEANNNGGKDNIAVIVIDIDQS